MSGRDPGWAGFFDGHAPVYEENCFTRNTLAEADFLLERMGWRPADRLLDVGCGTGRHAIELARRGLAVTGIDLSAGMLAEARRRAAAAGVQATWIQADAARFQLPAEFDGAYCLCEGAFGLLGATDDPLGQPLAILRNVGAALKPGAGCIFTVLSAFRMVRRHTPAAAATGEFDPLALAEASDVSAPGMSGLAGLRERGFMPTELVLLFALAGLRVENVWGGTAGNWGERPIDLDEFEIMVKARKQTEPPPLPPMLAALLGPDRALGESP